MSLLFIYIVTTLHPIPKAGAYVPFHSTSKAAIENQEAATATRGTPEVSGGDNTGKTYTMSPFLHSQTQGISLKMASTAQADDLQCTIKYTHF